MSDSAITHLIKSITDSQSARISFSTTTGEILHFDCIYKEGIAPRFFLVFPPKILPKEINMSQYCSISIRNHDEDKAPLSLSAKIEEIIGDRTLELTAKSSIDPTGLREFFRVSIHAPVTISFEPESSEDLSRQWSLAGETLDISGSGILALFGEECQNRQRIKITLELSSPQASIACMGHVVYTRRVRKGRWHIALHFDDIPTKQRDIIISNCLYEQRRQLKETLQPNS
ncbi:MAG: PilZ domain-containing protein [Desulfoprunum sp.]|nr:PilZ domain-containing protein [Desulfoprunum sp.]